MKLIESAVDFLFGGPKVGGAQEQRLLRWQGAPPAALTLPHSRARYVVVVAEAGGRDPWRPRLAAVDAVAIDGMRVDLAGCRAVALRGDGAGADPAAALLDLLEFVGAAPLVAYDAASVRPMVERAVRRILGVPLRQPWIDLAAVLRAHFPGARCATLAEWLANCGLAGPGGPGVRPDPVAVAQLAQIALDTAMRAGLANAWQLVDLGRADAGAS